MTVIDLVGPGRGDVAGLAALAARLRRAAQLLAELDAASAIRAAARVVDHAADRLRDLPPGVTPLEVEAQLGRDLNTLLRTTLLGSERTS